MKTVCEDWSKVFSPDKVGDKWFGEFETRAKNVAAEVHRVKVPSDANAIIADIVSSVGAKKVVGVEGPLQKAAGVFQHLTSMGIEVFTHKSAIRHEAETADIGISHVEFGVAETGSVLVADYAIEKRLVSTLVPIHIVFMQSSYIVPNVAEAINILSQAHKQGYLSFITGPSRTADIERVLTIGVHGPSRFIIIAVDELVKGGGQ